MEDKKRELASRTEPSWKESGPESLKEQLHQKTLELETMRRQLESIVDARTKQIERAKMQWERTFDAILDPLTLVGPDFKLRRVNMAAARQADREIRKIPGTLCYETLFGRDKPCSGCPLVEGVGKWIGQNGCEAVVIDKRKGRTFALYAFPIKLEDAGVQYVCYYKDETEKRNLQRQVIQSEKMAAIGQLAGGVAHELNNPIGVILSFTQINKTIAQELKNEELLDNLNEVERAALRCKKIVAELLDFARPAKEEELSHVQLNETIESALFLVSTQSATRSLTIIRKLDPSLPMVLGNGNQLLQVFVNLVGNAVQAMPTGGALTLSTGTKGGYVFASIQDTGVGIELENLNRIFEPFFTTKEPGRGTGLGLSVSYRIIERHSGRIEVESKPGRGSTFTVFLPIAPGEGSN